MKTAKEILNEKNCGGFDLGHCCKDIEDFFTESSPNAKLIAITRYFDYDAPEETDFYGYELYVGGEAANVVFSKLSDKKLPKIDFQSDFGVIEIETSAIRKVIDELRKKDFHAERKSTGIYLVSLI